MSDDVGSANSPSFIDLGEWPQDVKKTTNFRPPPPTVIRPDPLEKPWEWGVLESVLRGSPAGRKISFHFFTFCLHPAKCLMSTPSDPPPPALPMELDSTETQLVFLAQQCGLAKLNGDYDTANKFWNFLYPHLQAAFRALVKKNSANPSDQGDLHQEAALAVWEKIEFFDLAKAQNRKRPFTGWAFDQGRYRMREYFRKQGLSRVKFSHKSAIIEKLTEKYREGPKAGESWLDLAREHAHELASPPDLTEKMISNTLKAWSLLEASNFDKIAFGTHETEDAEVEDAPGSKSGDSEMQKTMMASCGSSEDFLGWMDDKIQRALEQLKPRDRQFLLQFYVVGLKHAEIAEKFNLENPTEKTMTVVNIRKIISNATKDLGGGE